MKLLTNFKNIYLINIFIIFIISCNSESKNQIIIKGNIINPIGETIQITGPGYMKDGSFSANLQREVSLDNNNNFIDTISITGASYYFFVHGRERFQLYLEPGNNLTINLNAREFDESITFFGNGEKNNTFLKEKFLNEEKDPIDIIQISKLEEVEYINKIESILNSDLELIKTNKSISTTFRKNSNKNAKYNYLQLIQRYPLYHEFYAKKIPNISDSFMSPLDDVDYTSDIDYKLFPSFKQLVVYHFQNILEKSDNISEDLKDLNNSSSLLIKKDLVSQGVYLLSAGKERNKIIYKNLIEISKDFNESDVIAMDALEKLKSKYKVLSKLEKGMKSPEFIDYENFNGDTTSLSDLKGKYVYIDVWATWCGPCIREIPDFKTIEKKYKGKNIEFVGISIDERTRPIYNYERWKEMIIEREIGGIQLFADAAWNSKFTKAYGIDSIPRYLLIDPDGNIVTGNAPRPSDPKLIDLFNNLGI